MKKFLVLAVMSLAISGCFFSSNDNNSPGSVDNKGPVDAVITWEELKGVWRTPCFTGPNSTFYQMEARFYQSGSETPPAYELKKEYFIDANCSRNNENWLFATQESGRADLALNVSTVARQLTMTTSAVYVIVRSPEGYSRLAESNECGLTYTGQEYEEITGLSCNTFGDMKTDSEKEFNIVGKSGTNRIRFGNTATGDGLTESTRPTTLAVSPEFTKLVE